jgi:hypothetical protein
MKYIFALCILLVCSVFAYRASSNSFRSGTESVSTPDSTYSGDGQLSYTIGDRKVNIKSELHTGGKTFIALYINEVTKKQGGMIRINLTNYSTQELVKFLVADKGTTHILHYLPSFSESGNQGEFMLKYDNYYADDATVQITAMDDKHVAGTFSGNFISTRGKKTIQITNGSFDVPYKDDRLK